MTKNEIRELLSIVAGDTTRRQKKSLGLGIDFDKIVVEAWEKLERQRASHRHTKWAAVLAPIVTAISAMCFYGLVEWVEFGSFMGPPIFLSVLSSLIGLIVTGISWNYLLDGIKQSWPELADSRTSRLDAAEARFNEYWRKLNGRNGTIMDADKLGEHARAHLVKQVDLWRQEREEIVSDLEGAAKFLNRFGEFGTFFEDVDFTTAALAREHIPGDRGLVGVASVVEPNRLPREAIAELDAPPTRRKKIRRQTDG